MTPTQVSYANMVRQRDADRETARSNRANEVLKGYDIAQTSRRNDITERQNLESNKIARENMRLTKAENAKQRRWQSKENKYNRRNQLQLKERDVQLGREQIAQQDRRTIAEKEAKYASLKQTKRENAKDRSLTRSENAKDRKLSKENKQKDFDAKVAGKWQSALIGHGVQQGRKIIQHGVELFNNPKQVKNPEKKTPNQIMKEVRGSDNLEERLLEANQFIAYGTPEDQERKQKFIQRDSTQTSKKKKKQKQKNKR